MSCIRSDYWYPRAIKPRAVSYSSSEHNEVGDYLAAPRLVSNRGVDAVIRGRLMIKNQCDLNSKSYEKHYM